MSKLKRLSILLAAVGLTIGAALVPSPATAQTGITGLGDRLRGALANMKGRKL